MSLFSLLVNFEKSKLPRNWSKEICKIIGEAFPESNNNVAGNVVSNTHISWQGSMEDAIIVNIQTMQDLDKDLNQKCVAMLTNYLSKETHVHPDRIFINFMQKVYSDMATSGSLLLQYM